MMLVAERLSQGIRVFSPILGREHLVAVLNLQSAPRR